MFHLQTRNVTAATSMTDVQREWINAHACAVPPMFDCGNNHHVACFLYDDKPVAEPADDTPTEGDLKLRKKTEKKAEN